MQWLHDMLVPKMRVSSWSQLKVLYSVPLVRLRHGGLLTGTVCSKRAAILRPLSTTARPAHTR